MATLKHRLSRIQGSLAEIQPDQSQCSFCRGRPQFSFADEPDNQSPVPFLDASGLCRRCRRPPPWTKVIPLSEPLQKIFTGIPWPEPPRLRFVAKLELLWALYRQDGDEADGIVRTLHAKAASGGLYWPALVGGPR